MTALLIKVTLLFLLGLIAFLASRRATASMRHLLCVCALLGSLLLPMVALFQASKAIDLRMAPLSVVAGTTRVMAKSHAWPSVQLLIGLWALGTALMLIRLALGHLAVRRALHSAAPIAPGIYVAEVNVPIASGVLRPVVLMPRFAAEWPDWQRAAAVSHERAHIERKDLLANLIAHLACALYWFHPLAWVLSSLLHREQETACDDAVLHSGFEPATYAEALLAVARKSTPTLLVPSSLTGCAMTTQIDVKARILRLLDRGIARTASPLTLRVAAAAFAGLVLLVGAGIKVRAQSDQPPAASAAPGQVYSVGGDVVSPSVIDKIDPQYTEEARHQKIAGPVRLSVVVGTDGLAHDISVLQSLDPGLDQSAAEAVQKWHFAPGTLKGEPVPVKAVIEVNFRLL
jgi:TonB family protein